MMGNFEVEFLNVYPPKKKNRNRLFVLSMLLINIVFVSFFIANSVYLQKENVTYAYEDKLLNDVVNHTEDNDKLYLFKGDVQNNYVSYNNMLWRIMRINSTGSMTLVLDSSINTVPWKVGNKFVLKDYLNEEFKKELDLTKLTKNISCMDDITDLNNITCEEVAEEYVSLLDVSSYIQTLDEDKTFAVRENESVWLANMFNENLAWHTNNGKLSYSPLMDFNEVKPVVTLNSSVIYEGGNGSIDNPYLVSVDKLTIGSIVRIQDDEYTVYSSLDNYKLVLNNSFNYTYTGNYNDLFNYLNDTYYEALPYKELLVNNTWDVVSINKKKISYESIDAYVGILSMFDLKPIEDSEYYTGSYLDNKIALFNGDVIYGSKGVSHKLKPCIVLDKNIAEKVTYQDGIFVVEGL